MKDETKLLREYVRHILNEEGDSPSGGSDIARAGISASDMVTGPGGGGGKGGRKGAMYMTFISPFTDVLKTAAGKTKELAREAITGIQVAIATVLTTLIPALNVRYNEIFSDRDKDISKIRNQYKDVYERTNRALASTDASAIAFLAAPQLTLTAWSASKTPAAMKETLSILTGGISDDLFKKAMNAKFDSSQWESKVNKLFKEGKNARGSLLKEEKDSPEVEYAKELLSSPKFHKEVLEQSGMLEKVIEVNRSLSAAHRKTLEIISKDAEKALASSATFEDIEKIAGKKASDLEDIKKLEGKDRQDADNVIMNNTKNGIKNFYVTKLKQAVKKMVDEDKIPEGSKIVKEYLEKIKEIESL